MISAKVRCLGIMVIYDPLRAGLAVERFKRLISNSFECHSIKVVTNNPEINGDIVGSNICGEFSGWAEAISQQDYDDFDVIICANDTFSVRRAFGDKEEKKFIEKFVAARVAGKPYLIGEVCWHINYHLMKKRRKFLIKWVRTSVFAISTEAARRIGGVSLSETEMTSMVKTDQDGNFMLSHDIPEVNRRRVEDWLNPMLPALGWYGSQIATKSTKRLKAMCVLQELDLTKRCIEAGISVYSSASVRKRDYLLTLLYNLQNRFL